MSAHLPTHLPGCVLRPWRTEDKADLVRLANNRRVWRNMTHTFPHPYTEQDADLWLRIAAHPGRSIQLATAQFGYWLGEPFWGRGIATAAATALATRIGDEALFARLEAQVFEWNPASMRVLEKAGFTREAVLPCAATKDGQLIATVLHARMFPGHAANGGRRGSAP